MSEKEHYYRIRCGITVARTYIVKSKKEIPEGDEDDLSEEMLVQIVNHCYCNKVGEDPIPTTPYEEHDCDDFMVHAIEEIEECHPLQLVDLDKQEP